MKLFTGVMALGLISLQATAATSTIEMNVKGSVVTVKNNDSNVEGTLDIKPIIEEVDPRADATNLVIKRPNSKELQKRFVDLYQAAQDCVNKGRVKSLLFASTRDDFAPAATRLAICEYTTAEKLADAIQKVGNSRLKETFGVFVPFHKGNVTYLGQQVTGASMLDSFQTQTAMKNFYCERSEFNYVFNGLLKIDRNYKCSIDMSY